VAQEPNWGLGRLIIEVNRLRTFSHAHTHTYKHPEGLPQTSDQPVAEAATNTTQYTQK